jgi:hypothetical protein
MAKAAKTTTYRLYVMRAGSMMAYSAQEFDSLADAKIEAGRLCRKSQHYPEGNYVEVRKVVRVTTVTLIDRFEAE